MDSMRTDWVAFAVGLGLVVLATGCVSETSGGGPSCVGVRSNQLAQCPDLAVLEGVPIALCTLDGAAPAIDLDAVGDVLVNGVVALCDEAGNLVCTPGRWSPEVEERLVPGCFCEPDLDCLE